MLGIFTRKAYSRLCTTKENDMRVHYRTGRRSSVSIGVLGMLLLIPLILAGIYAGALVAIGAFLVLAVLNGVRRPHRSQGLVLTALAAIAIGFVAMTTAGATTPKAYPLGHAKACKVGYSKAVQTRVVQVGTHRVISKIVECTPKHTINAAASVSATHATSAAAGGVTGIVDTTTTTVPDETTTTIPDPTTTTTPRVTESFSDVLMTPTISSTFDHVATTTTTFEARLSATLPEPADASATLGKVTITATTVNAYYPQGSRTITHAIASCIVSISYGAWSDCSQSPNPPSMPWVLKITYSGTTYDAVDGSLVTLVPQTETWNYVMVHNWPTLIPA